MLRYSPSAFTMKAINVLRQLYKDISAQVHVHSNLDMRNAASVIGTVGHRANQDT